MQGTTGNDATGQEEAGVVTEETTGARQRGEEAGEGEGRGGDFRSQSLLPGGDQAGSGSQGEVR